MIDATPAYPAARAPRRRITTRRTLLYVQYETGPACGARHPRCTHIRAHGPVASIIYASPRPRGASAISDHSAEPSSDSAAASSSQYPVAAPVRPWAPSIPTGPL